MDRTALLRLLDEVRAGSVSLEAAAERLARVLPGALGALGAEGGAASHETTFRIDHHRELRCGAPEVVLGSGKSPEDLVRIASEVLTRSPSLLVTRVDAPRAARLRAAFDDAVHHEVARCVTVERGPRQAGRTGVLVVCAGTADLPVAEEARVTAVALGEAPEALYDVGVAGLQIGRAHV